MQGTIHNRDTFLNRISTRLGREQIKTEVPVRKYKYSPQEFVLPNASKDELVEVLENQCKNIHTQFLLTNKTNLAATLEQTIENYGGGPVVTWDDERFAHFGLSTLLHKELPAKNVSVHVWNPAVGKKNIDFAEKANVGITISDITLAESGTAVLFSDQGKGRTVSFLPATSIILVPKSSIVPRITQAAKIMREQIRNGKQVPSCVNFITGPSNSADIELNLVVGVHGPVKATYIVVEDL